MAGNTEVHQHAPGMVDDEEEDVEHAERGGGDREEVDRGDALKVVGEKGAPSLPFVGMGRAPGHGARDGAFGDLKAELQDLAVDGAAHPTSDSRRPSGEQRARISAVVLGRPTRGRDVQHQYCLNPSRCQRMTVSGWTMASVSFHRG